MSSKKLIYLWENNMNTFNLSNCVLDEIVRECITLYSNLSKSGKPTDSEWTVLSCIVQYDKNTTKYEVVSLGTGSKCIGASKMSPEGIVLNDSHAEIFARRGFLLYLYYNIQQLLFNNKSIFAKKHGKFILKDNIEFLFYSSQMPCGDASIIPKNNEESFGDVILNNKHKAENDICDINLKKSKLETSDVHRTGAKCLPHTDQDPKLSGNSYHLLGQVRTKPGRGERTLSVSCSDKMARWSYVGIQGSLLDILLCEPIYIKCYIFGSGVPYSEETLNRAFFKRVKETMPGLPMLPKFYNSTLKFVHLKGDSRVRPASGSIVWVKTSSMLVEVAVQGKKLGVTKKKANPLKSLCICKYNLYNSFLQILNNDEELKRSVCGELNIEDISYSEMKDKAVRYKENWRRVKETFFKTWTIKPNIWNFCINR